MQWFFTFWGHDLFKHGSIFQKNTFNMLYTYIFKMLHTFSESLKSPSSLPPRFRILAFMLPGDRLLDWINHCLTRSGISFVLIFVSIMNPVESGIMVWISNLLQFSKSTSFLSASKFREFN